MMPVIDPFSADVWICWCGLLHTTAAAAGQCAHRPPVPFTPGHAESESMRQAIPIPYCRNCPGPGVIHQHYAGPRPEPKPMSFAALFWCFMIIICAALLSFAVWWANTHPPQYAPSPGPGTPVSTPTTYGPPGPNGGPR